MADTSPTLNLVEARGSIVLPGNLDSAAIILGVSSLLPASPARIAPIYRSSAAAVTGLGYGNVDTLTHVIERDQIAPRFYSMPATNPGTYGAINNGGVLGSALPAVDGGAPLGDFEAGIVIVDDGNSGAGTVVGNTGIRYRSTLDGFRTLSGIVNLGTGLALAIPNSGAGFTVGPSGTNAAYVTLAVELRLDVLAHLANVTAHDGADTSAAQIALAASSVPATVSASTAVVNLVLSAMVSHIPNITAHDGPDLVAYTALALLAAATNTKTGIDLAIALKGIVNNHEGVAPVAAGAGLMGATASIASPQTYTAAGNFLAGGVTAMDAQPRRVEIVISGSGTPANMADTVTLTGFDYTGAAQTETALVLTGLGTVKSAKAFKGTGLAASFIAADGTSASFTIGYSNGGHNSADVSNLITSANPTYGTLKTGDTWTVRTFGPTPDNTDIDAAFAAIKLLGIAFSIVYFCTPLDAAGAAHISSGLNTLSTAAGKRCAAIIRARNQDLEASETETAWMASIETDFSAFDDDRICVCAGTAWVTDPYTLRQYNRTFAPAFLARTIAVPRRVWPAAPADLAVNGLPGVTLVDTNGTLIGHDEGPQGNAAGLADAFDSGNRFVTLFRSTEPNLSRFAYLNYPWTMWTAGSRIRLLPTRRMSNAMEMVAKAISFTYLGGTLFYDPPVDQPPPSSFTTTLTVGARGSIQLKIFQALTREFILDCSNFADDDIDAGLVQVDASTTVTDNVAVVGVTLAPVFPGFVGRVNLTLAIQV